LGLGSGSLVVGLVIPPQPPRRVGKDGAAVLAGVAAAAEDKFVVVAGLLAGGGHLLVGEGPFAEHVVEVAGQSALWFLPKCRPGNILRHVWGLPLARMPCAVQSLQVAESCSFWPMMGVI